MTKADRSVIFLTEEVPLLLEKLQEDTPPLWGRMTPQHMVEHLQYALGVSRGVKILPVLSPWYLQPFYKWYILSGRPFLKNLGLPDQTGDTLPDFRYGSLEEAKTNLLQSIAETVYFLRKNPGIRTSHPFGGKFTTNEWRIYHAKHFRHHFRQFGLLPS